MRRLRALVPIALAVLLLAACASRSPRAPAAPVDPEQVRQAEAQRAAMTGWTLSGRVAVSNGRQGGSGRIDWTQANGRYGIRLAAPVTRQSWHLVGDAAGARLEGVEGGPREAAEVEALLREATGWEIPVRAMVDWVRGLEAPVGSYGPARVSRDEAGLPSLLEQAGWQVEYRDWQPAGGGGLVLPRRIEARQDQARVRLVVDRWEPSAAPGAFEETLSPEAELARTLSTLRLDDPAADLRGHVDAGDLRPVGVCGFACLAPGLASPVVAGHDGMRIIDGSGDALMGEHHLRLKHQAEAYAHAYNAALAAWLDARPGAARAGPAD